MRDNLELMAEYDIRDEYELHNLLKKVWSVYMDGQSVTFKKMPTIEIGSPNRDQQVLDLLAQHAPISNMELAEKYEEQYGAKAATVLANYFDCIDCYLHNSIYRMDLPPLTQQWQERMKLVLTEDFYRIAEVKRLYLREFPSADGADINVYVLKSLGFRVFNSYVVRDNFNNAVDYFRYLLTSQDIVDMREKVQMFCNIGIYWNVVQELKAEREIIEFSPNQYINSRRLKANGVTNADLEQYCDAVATFVRQGDFFTIRSLKQDGFAHPLDELGFEDWFYASVLLEARTQFSYQRMGGSKLFYRGHIRESLRVIDFLRWLITAESRMDLYDLQETLERRYGLKFSNEKLIEVVRGSDLYYDAIMEAVYVDYDTYFEEI